MQDYEENIKFSQIEPPARLYKTILARIETEKRQKARIRFVLLASAALVSLISLIPASRYFVSEFLQSGFYQYFSLLFSDSGTVLSYWKEFVLSLAESLPFFGLTLVLTAIFTLFGSLKLASKNTKIIFIH